MEIALIFGITAVIMTVAIGFFSYYETRQRIPVEMAEINMKRVAIEELADKIELRISTEDLKGLFK